MKTETYSTAPANGAAHGAAGFAQPPIIAAECPTCGSKHPHLHPAMQFEGEVTVCADAFHLTPTPQNRPDYIAAVRAKQSNGGAHV